VLSSVPSSLSAATGHAVINSSVLALNAAFQMPNGELSEIRRPQSRQIVLRTGQLVRCQSYSHLAAVLLVEVHVASL